MDKFRLTECQTLDIPAGNDVPLLVKLVKGFDGCDGEGAVPFPIDVCENVVVAMVSERGQVKSVAHRLGTDGEVLLELQAGDFRAGLTYGIDVRATLNGKAVHAYGKSLVRITAATERGPRQVAQAADPYEVTLQVGYVGDLIPRRLDELEGYDDLMAEVGGKADAAEVGEALAAVGREFQKYIPVAQKAAAGGVAELDANRKVFNDQLYFAPRGTTTAAAMGGELEAGLYLVNGFKVSDDVLDGDGANGFLLQGTGASRGQLLVVGRAASGDERELTEVYSRRYLPTPKRWTEWSKGGGGMAEVPPTILPNPMVKTSEGVYEFTAEVGKLYDLEKWDNLADVLRVHLPTPSDPSRGWKIGFIVQDNMQSSSWTNSDIVFMNGNREIINVQKLFDKPTQVGWQHGPWQHSYPQMILFKWVGKQWVVESFTNDVLYPFTYSLVREDDYYIVMKSSGGWNYKVACPQYSSMSGTEANAGTSTQSRVISASVLKGAIKKHTSDKANTKDVYTKTEADERFQPKGNYLTEHQDISGKQDVQQTAVYTADSTAEDFHPMELGSLQEGENSWTLYKFFFKVGNLPNNTSLVVSLAQLLANNTIGHIVSVHGVTSSGHFVSSGRTDNLSQVCVVQQGSRLRKEITLRTYADLSSESATLLIEFYGTKDA